MVLNWTIGEVLRSSTVNLHKLILVLKLTHVSHHIIIVIIVIHYVLACNKQLSELILQSVSGGVTPSTIPYMTDENLANVHQTPLSAVWAYLAERIPSH